MPNGSGSLLQRLQAYKKSHGKPEHSSTARLLAESNDSRSNDNTCNTAGEAQSDGCLSRISKRPIQPGSVKAAPAKCAKTETLQHDEVTGLEDCSSSPESATKQRAPGQLCGKRSQHARDTDPDDARAHSAECQGREAQQGSLGSKLYPLPKMYASEISASQSQSQRLPARKPHAAAQAADGRRSPQLKSPKQVVALIMQPLDGSAFFGDASLRRNEEHRNKCTGHATPERAPRHSAKRPVEADVFRE